MRLKKTLLVASTVCLITLGYAVITYGQQNSSPWVYNPYPPGILPHDLNSEIERVRREVREIEGRALARWHALTRSIPQFSCRKTRRIPSRSNPDEPSALAPCDDLSDFASHRVSSLARKSTHLKHQRGMKLQILS
jgi:hypothetical protein